MRNTYIFSDWTSVSQMINSQYPSLRAKASVIRRTPSEGSEGEIVGHCLTIYNKDINRIECKVLVNSGDLSFWSLSEDQAVEMLNDYGFDCRLERSPLEVSDKVTDSLNLISSLGYSHIIREFRNGHGNVFVFIPDDKLRVQQSLSVLLKDYNYYDWMFLREGTPTMIEGILKGGSFSND